MHLRDSVITTWTEAEWFSCDRWRGQKVACVFFILPTLSANLFYDRGRLTISLPARSLVRFFASFREPTIAEFTCAPLYIKYHGRPLCRVFLFSWFSSSPRSACVSREASLSEGFAKLRVRPEAEKEGTFVTVELHQRRQTGHEAPASRLIAFHSRLNPQRPGQFPEETIYFTTRLELEIGRKLTEMLLDTN